jgi:hypothetical protein
VKAKYRPNIGWTTATSQARFSLGNDKHEAECRKQRIQHLWECVERLWLECPTSDRRATWSDFPAAQAFAHRLAKGETSFRIPATNDQYKTGNPRIAAQAEILKRADEADPAHAYVCKINSLQRDYPCIVIIPDDPVLFAQGLKEGETDVIDAVNRLKRNGSIPQRQQTVIVDAVGTLHEAIDRRIESIAKEYFDTSEGHVNDSGRYKQEKMKQLKRHTDDVPLANLDLAALDHILQTIRNRPMSERTGNPLEFGTCRKLITEFKDFLRWLDTVSGTGWEIPAKIAFLKTKVKDLETDNEELKPAETFTIPQLVLLNRYATPIERIFLLLGLNCGYGADQSGRLKIGEIHLDAKRPQIRRIRKKKGIRGIHLLWDQTIDGIRWALARHPDGNPESFLLLNSNGQPYWRKTSGGNRARGIAKHFKDLVKRVRKDQPDFPDLSFNKVRKTSGNLVRQLADAELAKLQLTHDHQDVDRNLRCYTNPKFARLFRVLRRLERKLEPVFEAATTPWKQPRKQYHAGRKTDAEILRLHATGLTPNKIAAQLTKSGIQISHMTVRRRLKAAAPSGTNDDNPTSNTMTP